MWTVQVSADNVVFHHVFWIMFFYQADMYIILISKKLSEKLFIWCSRKYVCDIQATSNVVFKRISETVYMISKKFYMRYPRNFVCDIQRVNFAKDIQEILYEMSKNFCSRYPGNVLCDIQETLIFRKLYVRYALFCRQQLSDNPSSC